MAKYIITCGGVFSGTGKGVAAASLALLMKMRGFKTSYVKFDPYLNTNAGILSPIEHGEVFLADDGTECDLDLGTVQRLAGIEMSRKNILTAGAIYKEVITEQERGDYLGKTVQVNPHVTDKVIKRLLAAGEEVDLVFAEIGGTVGDAESSAFYEAVRQFQQTRPGEVLICMVAPVLWVPTISEFKTKPLQNAVRELQQHGLCLDFLLCRTDREVPASVMDKVSRLTGVHRDRVFDAPDAKSLYEVPVKLYERQVDDAIVDLLRLKRSHCRIHKYRELVEKPLEGSIRIGVVGKYTNPDEAYLSLREAIRHAGLKLGIDAQPLWINAEEVTPQSVAPQVDAIIVPGGFDRRGVDGKIEAARWARENKVPFLGICLGLQVAVIEVARNVCGLAAADSQEWSPDTVDPVIHYVAGQSAEGHKSETMRLGAYPCQLTKGSLAARLYPKRHISERHRHRLEVNRDYQTQLAEAGFVVSGDCPDNGLIEVMEMNREVHPYFIATQAHPEFKSTVQDPHPLFVGLVEAAVARREGTTAP